MTRGLAELHVHLYGNIRWDDYLRYVEARDTDWTFYERSFESAFGRKAPVREILARHRDGDPQAAQDFRDLFVFADVDAGSFERFQAKFNLLINGSEFLRMHLHDDPYPSLRTEMCEFARMILAAQRREGLGYVEQRALSTFAPDKCRYLYEGLLELYQRETGPDLIPRLAVSLPRDDPWPQWEVTQELALGPLGESLTGIDFCFVEEGHPPKEKADFFAAVHEFNAAHPARALSILYHVGESFSDKSLESAVRWVQEAAENGAHRLGHAIALGVEPECYGRHQRKESVAERRDQLAYDLIHAAGLRRHGVPVDPAAIERQLDELRAAPADQLVAQHYDAERLAEVRRRQDYAMECVRATGAVIEVCPTSNRRIGDIDDPGHHPVHRFLEHGLPVVVASDDPGIFDTTLENEIEWVARHAGLERDQAEDLTHGAWSYRSEVLSGREGR